MTTEVTTKEALNKIATDFKVDSYYELAKMLSNSDIQVQATQIRNYAHGLTKMSAKVASRFKEVFDFDIIDTYQPGKLN